MDGAQRLTELLLSFRVARAVAVAIRLHLPELIARGTTRVEELSRATGTDPAGLRRLLRALAACGIVAETPDGRYEPTELSRLLQRDDPSSIAHNFVAIDEEAYHAWEQLETAIRTNAAVFERVYGESRWEYLERRPDAADLFNRGQAATTIRTLPGIIDAARLHDARVVCDIGGGNGALLAAVLRAHPAASGILFDLPQGVAGAAERFAGAGVGDRARIVTGDFFRDPPPPADAYLMKFVLHDWPDDDCVRILSRAREGMPRDARVLAVERVLPERATDELRARFATILDLHMLVLFGSRERTAREYAELFRRSGLRYVGTRDAGAVSVIESQYAPD